MSLVDLVDDLQVSGQQFLQQLHRPALQGLREDGVVGVGKRAPGEVPGLRRRRDKLSFKCRIFNNQEAFKTNATILLLAKKTLQSRRLKFSNRGGSRFILSLCGFNHSSHCLPLLVLDFLISTSCHGWR